MNLVTSRRLPATASELWLIVSDPSNMPAWNEKCQSIESVNGSGQGTRFKARFSMRPNKSPQLSEGEIIEWEEYERVSYRYQFPQSDSPLGSAIETYSIKPLSGNQCRLRHEVEFSNSGLPWWVQILIGVIGRFGRSVGPDPLDGIASLIQSSK